MVLPESLHLIFGWWINNLTLTKNPIRRYVFKLEIFSDASIFGWDVYCKKDTARENLEWN